MPAHRLARPMLLALSLIAIPALAQNAPEQTPPPSSPVMTPQPWTILRVGGDLEAKVEFSDGVYTYQRGRINTPLPVGYPAPTPPKAIDLKRYPTVRRAEVSSSAPAELGSNMAFWPLFNHIKRRNIEMTSPVEFDYSGMEDGRPDGWTMSFLYREPELGPIGKDGIVSVADLPPMTVVAIGMNASYGMAGVAEGLAELESWLASQTEWVRDGEPRAMHYNGPEVRARDRWMEVQLPVRRRIADAILSTDRPESAAANGE